MMASTKLGAVFLAFSFFNKKMVDGLGGGSDADFDGRWSCDRSTVNECKRSAPPIAFENEEKSFHYHR